MKRRPFSRKTNLKETISDNIYNNQKFYRTSQNFQKFNSDNEPKQNNSPERNKNLLINIKNFHQGNDIIIIKTTTSKVKILFQIKLKPINSH
jgi:hypothetical protein